MLEIKTYRVKNYIVSVPGSKSYSHRALIAAALSKKLCVIKGFNTSQDTLLTCLALKKLGVIINNSNNITVKGLGGKFCFCKYPIYLGNSGTTMRFFLGLIILGMGKYTLFCSTRMYDRPIFNLVDTIRMMGLKINYLFSKGFPPIDIACFKKISNYVEIDCSISSQYLSSLLLIAPCLLNGLRIRVVSDKIVSKPYVDMTLSVMQDFGIFVKRNRYREFSVSGNQKYKLATYDVEPDCSHACYFWAIAAITGGAVTVKELNRNSKQGDIKFLDILEKMGCNIYENKIGITVQGDVLVGIDVNMESMPDSVPILAVIASFAIGFTKIYGVKHIKNKESNRINAVAKELIKMGVLVKICSDGLVIKGSPTKGIIVKTYNDHRIAMSFAVAGLRVSEIKILDEGCVDKSFTGFWKKFRMMYKY